jgi:hypothetical protein
MLISLPEVPLDDPPRVVAQLLGGNEQVDRLAVGRRRGDVGVQVQQEGEPEGPPASHARPDGVTVAYHQFFHLSEKKAITYSGALLNGGQHISATLIV